MAPQPQPALGTSAQRPRAPAATRSSWTPRPARSTGRARAAPAAGPSSRSPGPRATRPAPRSREKAESAAPRGPGASRQRELGTREDPEARGRARASRRLPGGPRSLLALGGPQWSAAAGSRSPPRQLQCQMRGRYRFAGCTRAMRPRNPQCPLLAAVTASQSFPKCSGQTDLGRAVGSAVVLHLLDLLPPRSAV